MTASELRDVVTAASDFRTTAQRAREVFENFQASLKQMEAAADAAARTAAFNALAPNYNAAMQAYFDLGSASRAQEQRFEPCTTKLPGQPDAIRKRSAAVVGN